MRWIKYISIALVTFVAVAPLARAGIVDTLKAKIEIKNQYLDASKIQELGWKSKYSIEEGLDRTIKWYFDYFDEVKIK